VGGEAGGPDNAEVAKGEGEGTAGEALDRKSQNKSEAVSRFLLLHEKLTENFC